MTSPTPASPRVSHWAAGLALITIMGLQLTLLEKLTLGPNLLLPSLELALFVPLLITRRVQSAREGRWLRYGAIALISLISFANIASLGLLLHFLRVGGKASGVELLFDAVKLWLTNVILFGLWFWELDRGGLLRRGASLMGSDFLFPQMSSLRLAPPAWRPQFLDYLYISFTNAAAFSPTDVLPLSARAKARMMVQALTSMLTVILVAGRAVNILPRIQASLPNLNLTSLP